MEEEVKNFEQVVWFVTRSLFRMFDLSWWDEVPPGGGRDLSVWNDWKQRLSSLYKGRLMEHYCPFPVSITWRCGNSLEGSIQYSMGSKIKFHHTDA